MLVRVFFLILLLTINLQAKEEFNSNSVDPNCYASNNFDNNNDLIQIKFEKNRSWIENLLNLIIQFNKPESKTSDEGVFNFKLSILLTLMINIFIFSFFKIDENLKKKNKSLFTLSFEEGLNLNTLEVASSKEISELENNENLKQFFVSSNPKNFNYKIQSIDKKDIDNLKEIIKKNPSIINIDINYAR